MAQFERGCSQMARALSIILVTVILLPVVFAMALYSYGSIVGSYEGCSVNMTCRDMHPFLFPRRY